MAFGLYERFLLGMAVVQVIESVLLLAGFRHPPLRFRVAIM